MCYVCWLCCLVFYSHLKIRRIEKWTGLVELAYRIEPFYMYAKDKNKPIQLTISARKNAVETKWLITFSDELHLMSKRRRRDEKKKNILNYHNGPLCGSQIDFLNRFFVLLIFRQMLIVFSALRSFHAFSLCLPPCLSSVGQWLKWSIFLEMVTVFIVRRLKNGNQKCTIFQWVMPVFY